MTGKKLKRAKTSNQLARWDNEGGAPKSASERAARRAELAEEAERVLRCLGATVLMQWNDLPTHLQRALFEYAVSVGDPRDTVQLKGEIARFLHKYKNAG